MGGRFGVLTGFGGLCFWFCGFVIGCASCWLFCDISGLQIPGRFERSVAFGDGLF